VRSVKPGDAVEQQVERELELVLVGHDGQQAQPAVAFALRQALAQSFKTIKRGYYSLLILF
jgi:hypothetical protein